MKKKPARKRASKKSAVKPKPQKLSKQEAELLKVYDSYWDSYTKGDIKSISNLLIEDYNQVGSAETEFFTNKKQAVKFLHDTIDQVAGKAELRNRIKKVDYLDNFVLISEQCDLYALSDGKWMFYSKFRASTVMQQRRGKWKIIHQHSSVPDLKALEGENLAIDKIAAENQQLREAVKRRTVELENKYRELEIEAALERVRVRAMAMHHSSELSEVAAVLFKQISLLTKTPNRFNIGIVNEKEKSFDIWLTDQKGHSVNQRFVGYSAKSPVIANMFQAWKTKKKLRIKDLYGSELRNWIKYMHGELGIPFDMKQVKDHRYINSIFFSHGFIGTTTNEPIHSEVQQLLERFAKVFQQTYTRFLDLQKAESQAREAQIEAALERIRAASMAMHNSNELIKVVRLMDRAIRELGIDINGIQIVTDFSDIKKGMNVWLAVEGVDYLKKFHNPYIDHPTHHKLRQTLKDNQQFFTEKYSRVDKNRFLRFLYKHSDFRKIPKERKEFTLDALWWVRSSAINKNSILAFHRYYDKEFDEKENEILKRFGKAFEQSYTRFLDLQKAEAQAIEAQIEAALERVRSRSMGMQNTTEMQQVANETREQLLSLGLKIDALAMSGVIDNEADYDVWVGGAISQKPLRIPYNNNTRVQRDYNKVIKERPELFTKTYSGKIMKDYFRDLMATNTFNPEIEKFMLECKAFTTTLTFMKNSGMQIVRYTDQPFSDADNNIVIRFGKVFEQAYIRFLDLQNSEAQAREAQIEAALERVRARTMAMHVSEDVSEATGVLFKEIEIIGLNSMACGLNIIEDKDKLQTWTTKRLGENLFQVSGTLKLEHPSVVKLYKDWKSKKDTSIYKLKGDEVKKFYDGVYKQSDYKTPRSKKLPKILVLNNFIIPEGSLWVFTEEEIDQYRASVLKRFATVFSLTYRRYKDLQNSEAQAREAQIEAALERVRARTMAMHDSAELGEVAAALFEQISSLTYAPDRFQIAIVKEEDKSFDIWVTEQGGRKLGKAFVFKSPESPVVDEVFQAWRKKQKSLIQHLSGKKLNEWIKYVSQVAGIPFNKAQMVKDRYINSFFFSHGCIGITTNESPEAEALTLIERFVKVFQQTYTRFLDLQKAEAQAREAQIEAALERVRAQTMAMHNSEDVGNCIIKMFGELTALGVDEGTRFGIGILNHDNENNQLWTAAKEGKEVKMLIGNLDMTAHPLLKSARKAWKEQVPLHKYVLEGKDLRSYYQMLSNAPGYKFRKSEEKLPNREFHYGFIFEHGFFYAFSPSEFEPELIHITQRFSLLFAQTYRRYLDLVRAEGQAREAEIELALERVRARTMAMQRSEELPEAANTLFLQVQSLGIPAWSCGYNILSADKKSSTCIMSSEGELQTPFTLPLTEHKSLKPWHNAILKGDEFFVYQQGGDELVEHYQYMKSLPELQSVFKQFDDAGLSLPTFQVNHLAKFREGFLLFITYEPVPDAHEIFKRFTKVFEQTYTRFLDLKKAEAQAREAQIEAALERVRSRSMAMHKSEELADVIAVVSDQLQQLKIRFDHVSFAINSDEEDYHFWTAFYGKPNPYELKVPYLDNPIANRAKEVRAKGLKFGQDTLTPEENREWLEHMFKHNAADYLSLEEKSYALSRGFSRSFVLMPNILLAVGNYASKPYSKDDNQIIKRFAAVFEQSYTRFLDLQKSEAQAREAQIELSLERIRAQALAMRVSADLLDIVVTMRTEFAGLGHEAHYFWHMRWLPEKYEKAMTSGDGARIGMVMELPRHMHGDIKLLADWEKSKENTVVYVMDAGAAINYVDKMVSLGDFKQVDPNAPTHDDIRHIGGLTFIMARTTHGEIGYSLPGMKPDVPKGDLATLVRFAGAFDLAYKRFEDLLKTEAREKEAIRQASLDRVRAEIASMRTTKDLERITPLIWKELTILNIPFIRCGVFIMDEPQQLIHTFLSTPDGKAIAAFHLPYDAPGRTGEILVHWINKQVYVNHWDEAAFSELGDLLVQQGALSSKEAYLSTVPKDGIYLHCLPFMQGMLYVGNNIKLNNNDIHLIQSVADAFSTAYARYEDFNKLELAKQQVDKALVELKQAQTQLVQSEKMASLGELTAGIAHEIQNPLNFVNNFSEVSNELLVEMKEEIEKGNVEEVKAITEDVIANLEKILHHGKRADGIVKGMLQHSRSSSGVKEPTDINALADEYLRLAYHGLRAKDKSFNAKFETHFDENIGKVNVIPQDIGRVILNLITNAFYVVTERKRASSNEFEPLVIVSTKKENNRILISVKDNGNGIPDSIKEKIFQPFFTTKPTGQGTGLGLSLSYDIAKAHGGELSVETEEGKGSEFFIELPV